MKVVVRTNDDRHYEIFSVEQTDGTYEATVLPIHNCVLPRGQGHLRVKFNQLMTSPEQAIQNGVVRLALELGYSYPIPLWGPEEYPYLPLSLTVEEDE